MDSPDSRSPRLVWLRQCGRRLLTFWPAKMVGTTVGMTVFFVAYFWILQNPQSVPSLMPLTAVDRLIGFQPWALPVYLSLWLYVSLAPALVVNRHELLAYGAGAVALSVIGLGIFLLWPTAIPQPEVDWSLHPSYVFLKSVDASGNACPSLHVAFAVFTALWFHRLLRQTGAATFIHVFNCLWCTGILYSTVATRQHVALDVLAGAALGGSVAWVNLRWLRPMA